jgi:hypothetical protein
MHEKWQRQRVPMSSNISTVEQQAAFDEREIRRYVEILHECATGVAGKLLVSVFFEGSPAIITHHLIGDVTSMCEAIAAHAGTPGANVYIPWCVMRRDLARRKKGGEADVVAVLALVADMDSDTGKVGEMPFEPSFVIETSPGNSQQVILFDKPMSPADAKPLAVALQRATGADYGTADISHVWRIPGTLNWPSEAKIKRGRSSEPFLVSWRGGAV